MNRVPRPSGERSDRLLAGTSPRYASVAASLAEEIGRGRPAVGALLRTEHELCAAFGVSRSTVREALRRLREAGLVTVVRGVGTRVAARVPRPAYEMAVGSLAELMGYASPTRLVVEARDHVTVDAQLSALLGDGRGLEMLRLVGLRRTAGRAGTVLSCVEMFIPLAFATMAARPELGRVPVYRLIERHLGMPIVQMQQDVAAVRLTPRQAGRLGVAAGSPGLRIVRRFYGSEQRLLEATVNIHPSVDHFAYRISLSAPRPG